MSLLWFFEVVESLEGFFPHWVKGQEELDLLKGRVGVRNQQNL